MHAHMCVCVCVCVRPATSLTNDYIQKEKGDDNIEGDKPENSYSLVPTITQQLGAIWLISLHKEQNRELETQ